MPIKHNKTAIFILVIAGLLYLGNLFIDNPYTHSFVNFYLNERFLKTLPVRAEYQSMRVQLVPPSVHLFGVKVLNKMDPQEESELLSTTQASLSISLWSLFLAKPQIGDLELYDLRASWPPPPELVNALREIEPKPKNQKEMPARWPPEQSPPLASLTLHNAALQITLDGVALNAAQDPQEITTISTEGLDFRLDFRGWRDIRVNSNAQRLNIQDRGGSYFEDATVTLNGSLIQNQFRTTLFDIKSQRLNASGNLKTELATSGNNNTLEKVILSGSIESLANFSVLGAYIDLAGTRGPIQSKADLNVTIPVASTDEIALDVKGTAKSHGATIYDFNLYDSEADFTIDMDGISFHEVRVKSQTQDFGKAKGRLSFNKALDYDFQFKPENLPFDTLLGIFNVPFDVLNFNLSSNDLALKGKGDPFVMTVAANATLSQFSTPALVYDHNKYPTPPTCRLNLNLIINSSQIDYKGSQGQCFAPNDPSVEGGFPLHISGITTFNENQGMTLELSAPQQFNPKGLSYFTQANLGGSGKFDVRIHGPYSKVRVDTNVETRNTTIGSTDVGSLTASATIEDGHVRWTDVSIAPESGGSLLSKTGSIAFDNDLTFEAEISAADLDHVLMNSAIKDLTAHDTTLEMVVKSLNAKVSGPLLKPFRYQGDINVVASSIRDHTQEYASQVTAHIEGTESGYRTKKAKIALGDFEAYVDAKHTWSGPPDPKFLGGLGLSLEDQVALEISAQPGAGKSDHIQRLPFIGLMAADVGVKGTLSGNAKLNGTLEKLSGIAKVRIDHTTVLSIPAPSINSTVILDGAKLDAILDQGGNSLKGRLNLDLGAKGLPYKWYLTTRNFDARPLLPAKFSEDARNFAYITASWSMEGLFEQWWSSAGELELKQVRAKFYPAKSNSMKPVELNSENPISIEMKPNSWRIKDDATLALRSQTGSIRLGLGPTEPPRKLALKANGSLNMDSLRLIAPNLETATGVIKFEGGIFGSFEEPLIDFVFTDSKITAETASTWEPMSIGLSEFRPAVKDIQFTAKLNNNGVLVESFKATKGSGTLAAKGFYAFPTSRDTATDVTINIDNATFLYPFPVVKNFDSSLSGNIHLTGQGLPLTAAGAIEIRRARSNRDIDLREAILESIRSTAAASSGPSTLQPSLNFDININADQSITFNSRNIQAVLSSNLQLSGDDVTPEVSGLIQINRGKFFYKRDFVIQRGLINYDDPVRPDPSLDINAVSEVSGYRVSLGITGKASAPQVDFSIDPATRADGTAITKLEILTLLSRGSLPEVSATNTANAEDTAMTEALNFFAGQMEDTVQKVFDLSGQNVIKQVYIDTYSSEERGPVARFNMPLNITEELDLVLKVDPGTVNLSSEYALHDSISLMGGIESSNDDKSSASKRQGAPADTGVDIRFKFAFP